MRKVKIYSFSDLKENPDLLLTTIQVQNALGVSGPTLYRWRKQHIIPCYKVGGVIKYRSGEIVKFLKENEL